eukprot:6249142-Pyramimonas_sp.AAC.1
MATLEKGGAHRRETSASTEDAKPATGKGSGFPGTPPRKNQDVACLGLFLQTAPQTLLRS